MSIASVIVEGLGGTVSSEFFRIDFTIIDSPTRIVRVSIGNAEIAEALAVTPREVLVNAKARGETTLDHAHHLEKGRQARGIRSDRPPQDRKG